MIVRVRGPWLPARHAEDQAFTDPLAMFMFMGGALRDIMDVAAKRDLANYTNNPMFTISVEVYVDKTK